MRKFTIKFAGRLKGAIGKTSDFKVCINADNKDEAILKLYETYEHIIIKGIR